LYPKEAPPFTLASLKAQIPEKCFNRSTFRSCLHLAGDIFEMVMAWMLVLRLNAYFTNPLALSVLWLVYWFYNGTTMTGLWVLAHECGHGAFSASELVNECVGFVVHSFLTVPYHAWQMSHAKHHNKTNHMTQDEVWTPHVKKAGKEGEEQVEALGDTGTIAEILLVTAIGWYMYLSVNATGPPSKNGEVISHYNPYASIFPDAAHKIYTSLMGLALFGALYVYLSVTFGWTIIFLLYVPCMMVTNFYLVTITYLQHSDLDVPHYTPNEWTFLRGALATKDRTLGWFLDHKTHKIVSTHVCHHLFSKIPFYNADEATAALIPALGEYYCADKETNFLVALFRTTQTCRAVTPDAPVVNADGLKVPVSESSAEGILWFNSSKASQVVAQDNKKSM